MMKTKFLTVLLSVVSALGVLTSCNSKGDSPYITRQTLSNFINVTNDITTDQTTIVTNIGYTIELNLTQSTAKICIEGLKLPNGTTYGQLTFTDLPLTFNSIGWIEIKQMIAVPQVSAGLQAPTFSGLSFRILDRVLDGNIYYPLFDISYDVDNYHIISTPSNMINSGTTVVATEGKPDYTPGDDETILYGISLNTETMKATIQIQGAKFASAMPAMNMGFKDIPFTFAPSGMAIIKTDSLEPVLITGSNSSTPMPNYPITNLNCITDAKNNMTLTFTCTVKSDRNGTTTETPYQVTVNCSTPTSAQQ